MDLLRLVFLLTGVIAVATAAPCEEYSVLDDVNRNNASYVTQQSENMLCDRLLPAGWYRFKDSEMSTSCVKEYHCGTHVPIWLNGTLPTTKGEEKTLKTCGDLRSSGSCCSYTTGNVRVRNCGNYNVYFLTAVPGCSIAYCAGETPYCTGDQYSLTGFKPCSGAYPKLPQAPSLSGPNLEATDFTFSCKIPYPAGSRDATFEVTWLLDGQNIPGVMSEELTGGEREATLAGKLLQMELDKTLKCSVTSRFTDGRAGQKTSPTTESNGYWIGVKYVTNNLYFGTHTHKQTATLVSSIPVVCNTPGDISCSVNFQVSTDNGNVLTEGCEVTLTPGNWNTNTHTAMTSFNVTTSSNIIPTPGSIGHISLKPTIHGIGTEWNHVPALLLTVNQNATAGGAQCKSTGDPHIVTFDSKSRRYNNFREGRFVMVKQRSGGSFRVEARTWPCNHVTCNCAVAAREGNDVITIDMCNGRSGFTVPEVRIQNKNMFQNETKIVKDSSGQNFVLQFKSGATVKATSFSKNVGHLDITVTLPPTYFSDTEGLCGTYDGNENNDLRHPNGHLDGFTKIPNSFVDSWEIPRGSSLFERAEPLRQTGTMTSVPCATKTPTTDPKTEILTYQCYGCVTVHPDTATAPTLPPNHLPTTTPHPQHPTTTLSPNGPTPAPVMNTTQAKSTCEGVLTRFPSARLCIQSEMRHAYSDILDMCITDMQITGEKDMAISALNALMEDCTFDKITSPNVTSGGVTVISSSAKTCPGACSGNGECLHGICACLENFEGSDCSVQTKQPPLVKTMLGGTVCEQENNDCEEAVVIGENFNAAAICRLVVYQNTTDGLLVIHTQEVPATYQSVSHVTCQIPPLYIAYSGLRFFNISISNNGGVTWSNEQKYTVYSAICVACGADGSCHVTPNTCLINGNCAAPGDHELSSTQWVCDPSVATDTWTFSKTSPRPQPIVTSTTSSVPALLNAAYYTATSTGCSCMDDPADWNCACCQNYGCPCYEDSKHKCYDCLNEDICYA